MATITEAELAAYLKKRDEQLYSRLLLNRVFQGTVTGVFGNYPNYLVQVERNGEQGSDGNTYPVISNWEPAIGDVCDIIWRDDSVGLAAFPISSSALGRLPARHPYMCRVYWIGGYNMPIGWTLIPYNNSSYDYSSMRPGTNGNIVIPATGIYQVTMRAGTTLTSSNDITTGIWWSPAGGSFVQVSQGSRTQNASPSNGNASICTDIFQLTKGDRLNGYCWNQVSGAPLESGGLVNYINVCLLSRR